MPHCSQDVVAYISIGGEEYALNEKCSHVLKHL